MKKEDIKTGMIIVTRERGAFIVAESCSRNKYMINGRVYITLSKYNSNLERPLCPDFDIMEIKETHSGKDMSLQNYQHLPTLWNRICHRKNSIKVFADELRHLADKIEKENPQKVGLDYESEGGRNVVPLKDKDFESEIYDIKIILPKDN